LYPNETSKSEKNNLVPKRHTESEIYDLTGDNNFESPLKAIVSCPNCNKSVDECKINHHFDYCLNNSVELEVLNNKKRLKKDESG